MNAATSASVTTASCSRRVRRLPGSEQHAVSPRHLEQIASRLRPRAERDVAGLAPRHEVHRLHQGNRVASGRPRPAVDARAGRVDRDPRADVERRAARSIGRPHAGHAVAVPPRRRGRHVVDQHRAVSQCGQPETQRQAIGFRADVVVPHRRPGQAWRVEVRKTPDGLGAREDGAGRNPECRRQALVPVERDDAIQREAGPHRRRSSCQRPGERQHERLEPDGIGCDPGERAPLAQRLPGPPDVERLKIPEAPVKRAEVVERSAASEIAAVDERDRQPTLRAVVRDRQAVDAAADHEHVEGASAEEVEARAAPPDHRLSHPR